jgi:hypothetical protein
MIARVRGRMRAGKAWGAWWLESGRDELGQLLWERWDPIGFPSPSGGYKPPRDEYMDYVDSLERLLRGGACADDVDAFLREVVGRGMGAWHTQIAISETPLNGSLAARSIGAFASPKLR